MDNKIYAARDLMALDEAGNHYIRHVDHMTREGLHSKSDIAAELGWRDMQIAALQQKLDALAAENHQCKTVMMHAAIHNPICPITCDDIYRAFKSTDVVLNSVRADAVNHAATMIIATLNHQDKGVERALECLAQVEMNYITAGKAGE